MKVNIIANGGGLGHLSRCSALAAGLRDRNIDTHLFVPRHAWNAGRKAKIPVETLPTGCWPVLPEADITVVDSCPGGHYGVEPPSVDNLVLLARLQADTTNLQEWATRYRQVYYWEEGLEWLPEHAQKVDPIVWSPAPPRSPIMGQTALLSLRTTDRTRRWEQEAEAACQRLGFRVEYGVNLPFPAGRFFKEYQLVITHAGCCSYYEAQQAGVPVVAIPDPKICSDQALRAPEVTDMDAAIALAFANKTPARIFTGVTTVADSIANLIL